MTMNPRPPLSPQFAPPRSSSPSPLAGREEERGDNLPPLRGKVGMGGRKDPPTSILPREGGGRGGRYHLNLVLSPLLCVLLLLTAAGCRSGFDDTSATAFLGRWQTAYNSHDLPSFTALYAEKGFYWVPPMFFPAKSRPLLRQRLDALWRQRPDLRITRITRVVAGGDQIAFVWTMRFTAPLAKKPMIQAGASFMKIENGLIAGEVSVINPPRVAKK